MERQPNYDNLHLIAISNLRNPERRMQRWWAKKYRTPLKPYEEHTHEELMIEMLEDYYEANQAEAERFLESVKMAALNEPEWDGTMPESYERDVVTKLKWFYDRNKVDLSKYQSDEVLSDEQERALLDNLGRDLPLSKVRSKRTDEFEDTFEV